MKQISKWMCLVAVIGAMSACGDAGGDGGGGTASGLIEREIEIEGASLSAGRFSPLPGQIAASYDGSEEDTKIATMSTTGDNLQIVAGGGNYLTAPAWTPDGGSLIYYADGVRQVGVDGSDDQELFSDFAVQSPDMSPDGTKVVYAVNGGDIYIKDLSADGRPASIGEGGNSPRFSPDGTEIAYTTDDAVRIYDPATNESRDVVTGELDYLSSVDWFPDGQRLAITSVNGIETVDIAAGTRSLLVDSFAAMEIDVAPDGDKLLFGVNGKTTLTIVDGLDEM